MFIFDEKYITNPNPFLLFVFTKQKFIRKGYNSPNRYCKYLVICEDEKGITLWIHIDIPSLQWRHNESDGVSNIRCLVCLLNRLFEGRSKKTQKLRVTGLCVGISPVTGEFPTQKANNAEPLSIYKKITGKFYITSLRLLGHDVYVIIYLLVI